MKMICPQCGVKGSADSSLLNKKVKCPKCLKIFEVAPEVFQPIPVGEIELEQLYDYVDNDPGITSEEEVDDVLSKLLSNDKDVHTASRNKGIFDDEYEQSEDDGFVAAPADVEDEIIAIDNVPESEDDTLIIIEDFQEDAVLGDGYDLHRAAEDKQITLEEDDEPGPTEEELVLDEEVSGSITDEFDWDTLEQRSPADRSEEQYVADDIEESEHRGFSEIDEIKSEEEISGETEEHEGEEFFRDETDKEPADDDDLFFVDEEEVDEGDQEEDESTIRKCSACDEYVDPDSKYDYAGNVYCSKCVPAELKKEREAAIAAAAADAQLDAKPGRFTVGTLIKDAWHYSKGVKGAVWAGLLVMYLLIIGAGIGAVVVLPEVILQDDSLQALLIESGLQVALGFLSFVFTAGIIIMVVHKIGRKPVSWKMIFSGFSRFGSLLLLFIVQSIMLTIGFLLFILPGIYLSVGYILAIPLLFEKKLSPWQALEVSRQAVHKRWWTVFFSLIAMSILITISTIPLGLGLIWTIPMFIVLIGVLYYHFFGAEEE